MAIFSAVQSENVALPHISEVVRYLVCWTQELFMFTLLGNKDSGVLRKEKI